MYAIPPPSRRLAFPLRLTKKPDQTGRAFSVLPFLLSLRRCCRRRGCRNGRSRGGAGLTHSCARCRACRLVRITRPEEQRADDQDGRSDCSYCSRAHSSPRPCVGAGIKIVPHCQSPLSCRFKTVTFWKCFQRKAPRSVSRHAARADGTSASGYRADNPNGHISFLVGS
jgi:hypothetical protein